MFNLPPAPTFAASQRVNIWTFIFVAFYQIWVELLFLFSGFNIWQMLERDANQEALEQVERITESDRDKGEDLLESEDLKRQLREAESA